MGGDNNNFPSGGADFRGKQSRITYTCVVSRSSPSTSTRSPTLRTVFNVAPTQPVPVIRQNPTEPTRHLSQMRWGLIPSWSKDAAGAASMINARSETAATWPAFRDAMRFRRCLVPADAFYEWSKRLGSAKQPYCFQVKAGQLSPSLDCGRDGRARTVLGSKRARYLRQHRTR